MQEENENWKAHVQDLLADQGAGGSLILTWTQEMRWNDLT
jgi:hypothetical protein